MILALVRRNLHHQRWLLAALAGGAMAMEIFLVQMAAAFSEGDAMQRIIDALPEGLRRFIAGQIGELSFAGFVAFGFQHPAVLTMGLALVIANATQPAAERESGLAELFLAGPLTRAGYLAANLACVAITALAFNLAQFLGAVVSLALVEVRNEPPWHQYLPAALGQACLFLALGAVTLAFAATAPRRGVATARALGVIVVGYVLVAFEGLYQPLRAVSWISPFHYFQPIRAAVGEGSAGGPFVLLALAALASVLAFRRFEGRDL